jgi:hypothetical protein
MYKVILWFLLSGAIFFGIGCHPPNLVQGHGDKIIPATRKKSFSDNIYFLDSAGYMNFGLHEKKENLVSHIYGFFYNDTLMKRPSILTQEVPTCVHLMMEELDSNGYVSKRDMKGLETNKYVFTEHLIKINGFQKYSPGQFGDKHVTVFLFSVNFGTKFDKFFTQAIVLCNKNNSVPVILTLDPVYYVKNRRENIRTQ